MSERYNLQELASFIKKLIKNYLQKKYFVV